MTALPIRSIHGIDYAAAFERYTVPVGLQDQLVGWLERAEKPKNITLQCVLSNDLAATFITDDRSNQAAVRCLVRFLVEFAPAYSWGKEAAIYWPLAIAEKMDEARAT